MRGYLARRAILIIPIALLASVVIFLVMRVLPGDVALAILTDTPHTVEMREALREELGLNDPLTLQYLRWLTSMVTGGLGGKSLETGESIGALVATQMPVTLLLAAYAFFLSTLFSIPAGIAAASRRGRPTDYAIRIASAGGLAIPAVWLALVVLVALLRLARWSPPIIYYGPLESARDHAGIMVVPAALLAFEHAAHVTRAVRAATLDALRQRFATGARARGLSARVVAWRHAGRHAIVPGLTVAATELGSLLGATLVVEIIFGLPGIGRGLVHAALARDFPYLQSVAFLLVAIYLVLALAVDALAARVDPRVRLGAAK